MRNPGIERLIDDLPTGPVEDREELRRFTIGATRAASQWQISRAKSQFDNRRHVGLFGARGIARDEADNALKAGLAALNGGAA